MNAATQTIRKPGFSAKPQLVTSEAKRKGFVVKIQTVLGGFFRPSQNLDFETWRDLEFRNEREPERHPPVRLNRWM